MLTNQDFAGRVLSSLEDLRERLAVLEAEVRHTREGVGRLESSLKAHLSEQHHAGPGSKDTGNGASVTIRVNRKLLGGGGLVGGGVVAVVAGVGKALGWW
jgi:cation transporter-like permease